MKKRIEFGKRTVAYELKKSAIARRMRISMYRNGDMVVVAPHKMPENIIESFLIKKAAWILRKLDYFKEFGGPRRSKKEEKTRFLEYKDRARIFAEERIAYFNASYSFHVGHITIRNQKTRWGSCSKRGDLNFNYKIALLPRHLSDYIIVHELCHLAELNHSQTFWRLVGKTIPDYSAIKKELKKSAMKY